MAPPARKKLKSTEEGTGLTAVSEEGEVASTVTAFHRFGDLDDLCIDAVLAYVDIRELYLLAFCSRRMMGRVSYKHVVRAAVKSSGRAERTVRNVVDLLRTPGMIFVPSPLRLLRLANGRSCERLGGCVELQSSGGPKRVDNARKGIGLFVCARCAVCPPRGSESGNELTVRVSRGHEMLRDARVFRCHNSCGKDITLVWANPYTDASGERAGATFSLSEYDSAAAMEEESLSRRLDEIEQVDPWSKYSGAIISDFEESWKEREQEEQLISEERMKRQAGIDNNRRNKLKNYVKILEDSLDAADSPWNDAVPDILANKFGQGVGRSERIWVNFRYPFVASKMEPYIRAPSSASKKKIQKVAIAIKNFLDKVWHTGFHNFNFLSADHPFEHALLSFYKGRVGEKELLMGMGWSEMERIEEDRLLLALCGRFTSTERDNSIVDAVVNSFVPELLPSRISHDLAENIARKVWGDMRNGWSLGGSDKQSPEDYRTECNALYSANLLRYQKIIPATQDYLTDIRNSSYFEREGDSDSRRVETKERLEMIPLDVEFESMRGLAFLEKRDFEGLRNYLAKKAGGFLKSRLGPAECESDSDSSCVIS